MEVIVVDGRDVPDPEHVAMLAALYSRSPRSVKTHLEEIRKKSAASFMSKWYVGYGHRSIGDCGHTAMFVEHCSMLAAKAIQDTPLYCGQEASTRYLDMSKQEFLNPAGTEAGRLIQEGWRTLYSRALVDLVVEIRGRFPHEGDQDETTWKKATKARAFDVARSILPAGATTFVAWTTNLRQANDHLAELRAHTLPEVREVAEELLVALRVKHPNSFSHAHRPEVEAYARGSMASFAFHDPVEETPEFQFADDLDHDALGDPALRRLLEERPRGTELHQRFRRFGSIAFEFTLDFGSYRDLQRHRSCVQEMPLLTTRLGFHPWYLERLPGHALPEIQRLTELVDALDVDDPTRQYYTPMGYLVPVAMSCPLPAAVYIAELRTGASVHPTLRERAKQVGDAIRACLPGIALHLDETPPDAWNFARGKQDIVEKTTGETSS